MKRQHFVKMLMGCGLSRNIANNFVLQLQDWRIPYSECIIMNIIFVEQKGKRYHYKLEFWIPSKYATNITNCKSIGIYHTRMTYPLVSKRKLSYKFAAIKKRIKFKLPTSSIWWLRSPYAGASIPFFRVGEQHYGLQKSWLV